MATNPSTLFLLEIADILESIDDYDRIEIILKSVDEVISENKMNTEDESAETIGGPNNNVPPNGHPNNRNSVLPVDPEPVYPFNYQDYSNNSTNDSNNSTNALIFDIPTPKIRANERPNYFQTTKIRANESPNFFQTKIPINNVNPRYEATNNLLTDMEYEAGNPKKKKTSRKKKKPSKKQTKSKKHTKRIQIKKRKQTKKKKLPRKK